MQDPAPTLSTLSCSAYCPVRSSEESGAPSAGVLGVPAFPSLERGGLLDVCCCVCGAWGCTLREASFSILVLTPSCPVYTPDKQS